MSDVPNWATEARAKVYPCYLGKSISAVEMGLLRSVKIDGDHAHIELLATSGWCAFAAKVLPTRDRIGAIWAISKYRSKNRLK